MHNSYKAGVVFFYYTIIYIFGEYTCSFGINMMYVKLVVDMVVYDMHMWLVVFCPKSVWSSWLQDLCLQ
jgi:hypothetical protein